MVQIVDIDAFDGPFSELIDQLASGPIRLVRGSVTVATIAAETSPRAPQSFAEALAEDGLLGCVKDAPKDLSSNPNYLDGMGEE